MLENASLELKTLILLDFTRKLVIATSPMVFLREKEKQNKIKEVEKIKERKFEKVQIKAINQIQSASPIQNFRAPVARQRLPPRLKIPEARLPPQFGYLKPVATTEVILDLGKLNPLIADPAIVVIESNGPDQQIIVRGSMGTMPVEIILTKEEIDKIIQTFSEKSKIPTVEGVTKIVLGRFVLSAIISKDAGSRFIIKKMPLIQQKITNQMPKR